MEALEGGDMLVSCGVYKYIKYPNIVESIINFERITGIEHA